MKKYFIILIASIISLILIVHSARNKPVPVIVPIKTIDKVYECMIDEDCKALTESVYFEARSEPVDGMIAVMNVIKNRVEHPTHRWPKTIKDVISQRCEFSYKCDGSMSKIKDLQSWNKVAKLAYDFKQGHFPYKENVYFYHSVNVRKKPKFARKFPQVEKIGKHVFYDCNTKYC